MDGERRLVEGVGQYLAELSWPWRVWVCFSAGPNFLASGVRSEQPAEYACLAAVLHVYLSSARVAHAPALSDFVSS